MRSLVLLVHGEAGSGKSWLADTAPGPRLILDVEGGTNFTPSRKIPWNPATEPMPENLGVDDSVVVFVHDMDSIDRAYQWLTQSAHPFRSVIVDSLTEAQQRYKDKILGGASAMKIQNWDELGTETLGLVRRFRDLRMLQHPVEVVVMTCGSQEQGEVNVVVRPMLQGAASRKVGYHVDVLSALGVTTNGEGALIRRALFVGMAGYAAKDRTNRLGVTMDSPTIPAMLDMIYGHEEEH